ncbi:MAG TPA: DUF3108 domain-containing protein [Steroidobacteraceae bacterium]|nr:DUF3108 domain-containing protein [Steroidobacteraceae bacterium]
MPARSLTAGLLAIAGPLSIAGPLVIAGPPAGAASLVAMKSSADGRPEEPPVIAPFSAHYTADWRSLNVGTSDLDLKRNAADGTYEYTWRITARGVFRMVYSDDVVQRSWLSMNAGHVRPEKYRAEQGNSKVSIDFDWSAGRARGESEGKPVDLELTEGIQDVMSIQIEVMLDLEHGNLPKTFKIIDKDEIKDFLYTLEGPARLHTTLGELDTVVVASQRAGNNRVLKMWFAPTLGYIPVQAERSRDGKLEFAMRIKTLKR